MGQATNTLRSAVLGILGGTMGILAVPALAEDNDPGALHDPRMAEVVTLIRTGQPASATVKADAVIDGFAKAYKAEGVSYYCDRGSAGADALAAARRRGENAQLAPQTWCAALFAKGYALIEMRRFDAAGAVLDQAVRMDPENPHFRNRLGDALRLGGHVPAAFVQYREAYELARGSSEELFTRMAEKAVAGMGACKEAEGDAETAKSYYQRAAVIR